MRVVVTDRPFPEPNPYKGVIEETAEIYDDVLSQTSDEIVYANCETEEDAIEACRDADVVITFIVPITKRVMEAATDLDLIIRQGAGYDNVDVQAATTHGIPVSNVPDYGSGDVAAHGITLALAASHNVVSADKQLRNGSGWGSSRMYQSIRGGTYGIVGLGRIGRRAVPMARGLEMDVIAYDPVVDADVFDLMDVESVSFEELLRRADCVTIHAPLSEITHHMFSTAEFKTMQESAILVNVARGPIVDEEALVTAVQDGEIRAAGLDVYEEEPPDGSPVLDCEAIVCSPHHAGGSPTSKQNKIQIVRDELARFLRGDTLANVVNQEVFQFQGGR